MMLRILGSLAMMVTLLGFFSFSRNVSLQNAAARQGDQELAAGFGDNANEAFLAGLVFGGMTLALWIASFLVPRRSTSPQPRLFRCPFCNATISQQEVSNGWCEGCGKRLPLFR